MLAPLCVNHVQTALSPAWVNAAALLLLLQTGDDDAETAASNTYQLDMMRCLREVNVDNNTVGWYQSSSMGSFQTQEIIDTFTSYHDSIKK